MSGNYKVVALSGFLFAASLAVFVSPWADPDPDGLTKIARQEGFAEREERHALEDSPLSGYAVKGVDNDRLSTGLAGFIGVLATFGLTMCVLTIVRRKRDDAPGKQEGPN